MSLRNPTIKSSKLVSEEELLTIQPDEALAPDRFAVGATAIVTYPDEKIEFEKTPDGWQWNSR